MSNPFADYGHRATSQRPPQLIGQHKTRKDAKERYDEIVKELNDFSDPKKLEIYLMQISKEIAQFRAELRVYWEGDGTTPDKDSLIDGELGGCFLGLQKEIERAQARVDDGLDFPRYEVTEKGIGL